MKYLILGVMLLVIKPCLADVHSLHRHGVATQGVSFPQSIDILMVDDIIVHYYMTASKEFSIPQWLNHSEGVILWEEIRMYSNHNRFIMDTAIKLTSKRFNHSYDHFYQAHGRCEWDTEEDTGMYVSASMSHAYDGKDFVSFDVTSRTWVAAVSEAVFYQTKRQENIKDLDLLIYSYNQGCIDWLTKLLRFSKEERKEKVPDVVLTEKSFPGSSDKLVTCHVTGFYPRAVQVEWLNQDGHVSDGVSIGEVLPNCDGTYQVKQTLKVANGTQWSQVYRCQVIHSSVTGNITVVWDPKKSLFLPMIVGITIGSIAVTVLIVIVCFKRGKCHQTPAVLCRRTSNWNLPPQHSMEPCNPPTSPLIEQQ
ncbi:major histocompatibility complex class I-related gene protein-like [Sardina pilchardus]|uniref:major histocompatibility complex class I-related gene protein-like n=1 Tax=Sardina pilchardus TaxID=27697 RepID=UPI002E161E13